MNICVIHQRSIEPSVVEYVKEAVTEVFVLAQNGLEPEINILGQWDSDDWSESISIPVLYRNHELPSVSEKSQLDAEAIMGLINYEFIQKRKYKYALYIVSEDMYSGKEENCFLVGASNFLRPAIVSTYRFSQDVIQMNLDEMSSDKKLQRFVSNTGSTGTKVAELVRIECIKTVAMHELGHVFGLVPETQTEDVEDIYGYHCKKKCVMRQGLSVPSDWIGHTLDRIESAVFCPRCLGLLKDFLNSL